MSASVLFTCNAVCIRLVLTYLSVVITDPEDPRFDIDKLVAKWESESK